MATMNIDPPKPFNFSDPDDWPRWKKRFLQFRDASNLSAAAEPRQVSTLLYCLGEDADDVLTSTNATQDERKKFDDVLAKFDAFFRVRQNVIFERAKFNKRVQLAGESAEQFITSLYHLAETCNYQGLKEEMIRDRLVVGIRDQHLSQQLQMDPDLTLEKAKIRIRQKEAIGRQQDLLNDRPEGVISSDLENIRLPRRPPNVSKAYGYIPLRQDSPARNCGRCGKGKHTRDRCPARDITCFRCAKRGHYSSMCLSKKSATDTVQHAEDLNEEETEDDNFLGAITAQQTTQWLTEVSVNKVPLTFKIDTGAEVSAISEAAFDRLPNVNLEKCSRKLYGPAMSPLCVLGQFTATLTHKQATSQQNVFVVQHLKRNLLGLPALISLNLVSRLDSVECTKTDVEKRYPQLFNGLGQFGEEYEVSLKEGAKPFALYTARNIPLPLRSKVQNELKRMESLGVISPVSSPSPWCAGMVVVPKSSGKVRICVDLKRLNESVQREYHPLPRVEETLAQLSGAQVFTKLDANSGFWQIPLARSSRLLTTFITPFGRYCFNVLPFGITSAPELFQRRMSLLLNGMPGVVCLMDDVLIFGKSQAEHDARLEAVLKCLVSAGVTLNPDKCEFSKSELKFLGHIVNSHGVQVDPAKTDAILQMGPPKNVSELRRFIGMTNHLSKFIPCSAELTKPLTELLSSKRTFCWEVAQSEAFKKVKEALTNAPLLALYDPGAETMVSADASSFGLGAVIMQRPDASSQWRAVAFASRTMTETEVRYAQIEKEALALTWACEKFSMYLIGRSFTLETDHKPLLSLLGQKNLDSLPPRVLRFRLRMMRYDFTIVHVAGKSLLTADTLSRAPLVVKATEISELQSLVESFVATVVNSLPASSDQMERIRVAQMEDSVLSQVIKFCQDGWPAKHTIKGTLKFYWNVRCELSLYNHLLLRNNRIVIPAGLQQEILNRIHQGHQGITKCRLRASTTVWWPGVSQQIISMVQKCKECCQTFLHKSEPMIPSKLPQRPWQKIGTDLFEFKGVMYLLLVDYYSRFIEVAKLSSTTTRSVVSAMKSIFGRYGIPEVLISDNGPQYSSHEFMEFASSYDFKHITSSPYHPQGNGEAERAVKTVKKLLKNSNDPNIALLAYRSTPLSWCHLSPSQLLMGRQLRSTVPMSDTSLAPKWPNLDKFRKIDEQFKLKQKRNFDRRHRVVELPNFGADDPVFVATRDGTDPVPGRIVQETRHRSYEVQTPTSVVRRNRSHLHSRPDESSAREEESRSSVAEPRIEFSRSPVVTRSRTGTVVRPPDKLNL